MQGKTCCVTGHRDIPEEQIDDVKQSLEREVDRAIRDGFTSFLSGFAEGTDLLFAEIVAERIAENPALQLRAAIPYRGRLEALKETEQTKKLLDLCTEIYVAAETYNPGVYAKRNRCMVERSERVLPSTMGAKKAVQPEQSGWRIA